MRIATFAVAGAVPIGAALLLASSLALALEKQELTIADAIQTTRPMAVDEQGNPVVISPDGRRYALMLIRGDIPRDGMEIEIVSGRLDSLVAAVPQRGARLFSRGWGRVPTGERDAASLTIPLSNIPVWINDHEVAFLWQDEREVRQVVAADVDTHAVRYLTHAQADVQSFQASPQGTVIYRASLGYSPEKSQRYLRDGYTVTSTDVFMLICGVVDGTTSDELLFGRNQWLISSARHPQATPIKMSGGGVNHWSPLAPARFSPDGRFAIVDGSPAELDPQWGRYTEDLFHTIMQEWTVNPKSADAKSIQRLFLVDAAAGTARPLWAAPSGWMKAVEWSPNGRAVLLVPTFVPLASADAAGLAGEAVVVIEPLTGRFSQLPVSLAAHEIDTTRWISNERIELRLANGRTLAFRKRRGGWAEMPAGAAAATQQDRAPIRVELRQGLNEPPRLHAVETASGREQQVLDLNPGLTDTFRLGRVEMIHWRDANGHEWKGRLFYPVEPSAGKRYPLVIQTNVFSMDEHVFSLYGPDATGANLGPGWSAFLAQPLANRGIAVLQGTEPLDPEAAIPSKGVRLDHNLPRSASYAAAAEHLANVGLVDRERVGIMGFSNRGWHVEHSLAFSPFPYAAAIASDNIDGGYMQAALGGWTWGLARDLIGEQPFAEGLEAWLENSPSFNIQRVRTPLMIQVTDAVGGAAGPIVEGWETYSRLRYLDKPAELYVAPNILRGSHNLQNPTQLMGVQQRSLDWWLFWLKGEEDPAASKAEQYASWRELRKLHEADLRKPRPPLLDWSVKAISPAL